MTLSEVKDPDGEGLFVLSQNHQLVSPASGRWGQAGGVISQHPCLGGLEVSVPWSRRNRAGGVPLKERRPTGWDKKEKEGWFGPQGKDRKALTPTEDSVLVQLKAAPLG